MFWINICRTFPSFHSLMHSEYKTIPREFIALDVSAALTKSTSQRCGPSEWSRGRSCTCVAYGGLGERELLPDRAAVCAEPRADCSHSGLPPPASCWGRGRRFRSEGDSPPPRRCTGPTAAEKAARLSWNPGLSGRRACGAGGAVGGCCGKAKEPWGRANSCLCLYRYCYGNHRNIPQMVTWYT